MALSCGTMMTSVRYDTGTVVGILGQRAASTTFPLNRFLPRQPHIPPWNPNSRTLTKTHPSVLSTRNSKAKGSSPLTSCTAEMSQCEGVTLDDVPHLSQWIPDLPVWILYLEPADLPFSK
jgi:hypothetical protein